MGLIRTERESGDWFVAHKHWATNEALSWEARGLLAYLFSKPDDWTVMVGDLVSSGPCKKYKIRRLLKELVENGYAIRKKERADDGTFQWVTTIRERPSPTQSRMDAIQDGPGRGYTKESTSTKEGKEGSSSGSAGACADGSGHSGHSGSLSMPQDLLPVYDTYEPVVNSYLEEYEPDRADEVVMNAWGQIGVSQTIMHLAKNYDFPYFVAGVVISGNEADNPNARYLHSLLKAITQLDEHTQDDPTKDEQQSNLQRLLNAARTA